MGTTTDKLNKLLETKSYIKGAIIDKGVDVPDNATFASFSTYIGQISTGIVPTGNIELYQQSGTNVTSYATASVKSGTAGTPTASKGGVSSYSMVVTPSVTNTAGWISSGTKTGTGVTVSASELVSGTRSIIAGTSAITSDVTNYASVTVNPTPSESKTAIMNGTVTPSTGKLLSSVIVNVDYKTYRTGSGAPSSSLGNDGDVYFDIS